MSEMRDSSEANAKRVSRDAYLIVLGMECAIGLIAYCTFLDKTKGNVLLDFSPYSPVAVVARLALLTLLPAVVAAAVGIAIVTYTTSPIFGKEALRLVLHHQILF